MEAMVTIGFISFCCMLIFFMLSNFLLNDDACVQDGAYCIESDCIGRCLVVDLLEIRFMY